MFRQTRYLRYAASPSKTWADTLHLPKTQFPARPATEDLRKYRKQCADDFYKWQKEHRPAKDANGNDNTFVLHDGPPYANGDVHVGHALNKILKDLILRTNLSSGRRVEYRPGWDCHGLPIELKALQSQPAQEQSKLPNGDPDSTKELAGAKTSVHMQPLNIREAARKLAAKTVEDQKAAFQSWGVMGEWDSPYLTMNKDFEIRQLKVFRDMVAKGLIYRQNKPVHWSPSSRTALAEAELEYDDNHRVTAAFVKFPLTKLPTLLEDNAAVKKDAISALIWTTTPWTLPANKAIGIHPGIEYCLVEFESSEATPGLAGQMLVAKVRLQALMGHLPEGTSTRIVVESIPGRALSDGCKYINVISGEQGRIISADFVTSTSGTGLVHMAPGHGMEDYSVLTSLGIGPAFAPVDDEGKFTAEALPKNPATLEGLYVESKGAKAVLDMLRNPTAEPLSASLASNASLVLAVHEFKHKNPIDWRTKQPVITRATDQWFANVASIQKAALQSLNDVDFIPESGKTRLESFVKGRSQWCISRQRSWGVPIPALFRKDTGEAVMTADSIDHIISVLAERGSDAWWSDAQDDPAWIAPSLGSTDLVRGKDTMDVWFDSGSSWTSLTPRPDDAPADVYVEGSDQHRGWFQSSLLTHVAGNDANNPKAPFNTLITHGFTLDHEGRKMSKSLGNVVTPAEILTGSLIPTAKGRGKPAAQPISRSSKDILGPDVLRLWVASSDYSKDVVIGQQSLQAVHRDLQKYRVTFRWLLGVLNDYPVAGPQGELMSQLSFADEVVLSQLGKAAGIVHESNGNYEFYKSVAAINRFINADLSAFYFEVVKDRMYAGSVENRLHTQVVLYIIMSELLNMLTPICPHLVEEVWAHVPDYQKNELHPHPLQRVWDAPWIAAFDTYTEEELEQHIKTYTEVSRAVKVAQEEARKRGRIGSSLACEVEVLLPNHVASHVVQFLHSLEEEDELSELLVVSNAEVLPLDPKYRQQYEETEMEDEEMREAFQNKLEWRKNVPWTQEVEFDCGTPERPAKGKVVVLPPYGKKCDRCWQFTAPRAEERNLCYRCQDVLEVDEETYQQDPDQKKKNDDDDDEDGGLANDLASGMSNSSWKKLFGWK
ncbi:hypothetical protein MBLNU457_4714t1 [Dothideomycetes sp. NU457]